MTSKQVWHESSGMLDKWHAQGLNIFGLEICPHMFVISPPTVCLLLQFWSASLLPCFFKIREIFARFLYQCTLVFIPMKAPSHLASSSLFRYRSLKGENSEVAYSTTFASYRGRPYFIPCSAPHFSSLTPPSLVCPQIEYCLNELLSVENYKQVRTKTSVEWWLTDGHFESYYGRGTGATRNDK